MAYKMGRKILVVSDSHGRMDYLRKAIEAFGPRGRDLEMMIHLGDIQCPVEQITGMVDCPVEIVRGNNDFNPELPGTKLVEIGDEVAMITHGHRYGMLSWNRRDERTGSRKRCRHGSFWTYT